VKKLILKVLAVAAIVALPASAEFFPTGTDNMCPGGHSKVLVQKGTGFYDPLGLCGGTHQGQSPCRSK